MGEQVEIYNVTCPANTPTSAPVEVPTLTRTDCALVALTILLPPGHAYLTGISVAYGHNPVLPYNAGAYFTGDDDILVEDMTLYSPGMPWSVFLVNLDTQAHVWQTRWTVNLIGSSTGFTPPASLLETDIQAAAAAIPELSSLAATG